MKPRALLSLFLVSSVFTFTIPFLKTDASLPSLQTEILQSLPTRIDAAKTSPDFFIEAGPISGTGDFNGDGIDDLLQSLHAANLGGPIGTTLVRGGIIFGRRSNDLPQSGKSLSITQPDLAIAPTVAGRFMYLRSLADLNGDGIDEIISGVDKVGTMIEGTDSRHAYFIYFGSPQLQPGRIDLDTLQPDVVLLNGNDPVPDSLWVTDINGDGNRDIIYGNLYLWKGAGSTLEIHFGPFERGARLDLKTEPADIIVSGIDFFTEDIRFADINGDSIEDALIGRQNGIDVILGSKELKSGSEIALSKRQADVVISGQPDSYTPISATTFFTGDVNGDHISDILIGNPDRRTRRGSIDSSFSGEVYVIFGSSSLPGRIISLSDNQQDMTIKGAGGIDTTFNFGDSFGSPLLSGDINGDGIDDILVGAARADGSRNEFEGTGEIYVILGSTDFKRGSIIRLDKHQEDLIIFLDDKSATLGLSPLYSTLYDVSFDRLFDFNGDGAKEIPYSISKPLEPPPPPDSIVFGKINILFGNAIRAPQLTQARFEAGNKLLIFGDDLTGGCQVEVNGVIIDRPVNFVLEKGRLVINGERNRLNLRRGQNEVTVIKKGTRSNTIMVRL